MRAGFIVSGVLGAGTVLVFVTAVLVAMLFPNGTTVASGWNGGWAKGGWDVAVPAPAPVIVPADGGAVLEGTDLLLGGGPEK